jgi:hypothetical protein
MRVAGLVLLALVVATAAWRVVPAFEWVGDEVDATRGLTRLGREVAPARSVDIDPRPIEAAAAAIPEDDTFAILVGPEYPFTHPVSGLALPSWAAYRLLPRRRVADAAAADWVISYGADLAAQPVSPLETTDLGLGVTLVRLR